MGVGILAQHDVVVCLNCSEIDLSRGPAHIGDHLLSEWDVWTALRLISVGSQHTLVIICSVSEIMCGCDDPAAIIYATDIVKIDLPSQASSHPLKK